MKPRRALVTGAHGFSGQNLVRYLRSESVEVETLSLRGAQLTDAGLLSTVLHEAQPDYIFHLAGVAAAGSVEEFFRVNVVYASTLLEAARAAGLTDRPFLIVGTAAEYGEIAASDLPVSEETPSRPYGLYGITKLAQTHLALAAARTHAQTVIVARPFNIIGAGMPGHLALASFQSQIQEIKEGRRPPVISVGNLEAARDFIDVDDVVRLYWKLVQRKEAAGRDFNLCTGNATSLARALQLLIGASGVELEIKRDDALLKGVDIPIHYGSNARLHALIGSHDYIPLEESIQRLAR